MKVAFRKLLLISSSCLIAHSVHSQEFTNQWIDMYQPDKTIRTIMLKPYASYATKTPNATNMFIMCDKTNNIQIMLGWDQLASDKSISNFDVKYQIGGNPFQTGSWDLTEGLNATIYHGDAMTFLQELEQENDLVAIVTPVGATTPETAIYNIRGLSDAVKPVLQACGYQK